MANLKEVRTRIESVNSTKQITSAMKMVAASKLRKSQNAILALRPYAEKFSEILERLTANGQQSMVNGQQPTVNRVLIIPLSQMPHFLRKSKSLLRLFVTGSAMKRARDFSF